MINLMTKIDRKLGHCFSWLWVILPTKRNSAQISNNFRMVNLQGKIFSHYGQNFFDNLDKNGVS